jgi:hypothetical protein
MGLWQVKLSVTVISINYSLYGGNKKKYQSVNVPACAHGMYDTTIAMTP